MSSRHNAGGNALDRAVMPLAAWSAEDRAIWEAALADADPFEDTGGERARMRLHSNRRLCASYGRWLTFLHHAGELTGPPASRIKRDLVTKYVQELREIGNMPSTINLRLSDLLLMARLFDKTADWSFISRLAERVRALPTTPKHKRSYLRTSHELLDLGLDLIGRATSQKVAIKAATLHRDGLIIALLALVPLRGKNFVQLRLGIELNEINGTWTGYLTGETTKNHSPLEFVWPENLVEPLKTYLDIHRPLLLSRRYRWLDRAKDHLWVAQSGSALKQNAFCDIIRKRTRMAFGKAINPHAFRDAAATTLAIYDPMHVRAAGPVLGHRTQGIAEKYYNQAMGLDAHRQYANALAQFRRSSRRHSS